MPRGGARPNTGGARPGAGRPRKPVPAVDSQAAAADPDMLPLAYMLQVMRDPTADGLRRDRMAIAAAPYTHPKAEAQSHGKKDAAKDAAGRAGKGRLATPATPPRLIVNNKHDAAVDHCAAGLGGADTGAAIAGALSYRCSLTRPNRRWPSSASCGLLMRRGARG